MRLALASSSAAGARAVCIMETIEIETSNNRNESESCEYDPVYRGRQVDNHGEDLEDDSSVDSCLDLIEFKSIYNRKQGLETGISCSFQGSRRLHVSTLLEEGDIAPLFSGAEWAGTRVWHAAVRAIEFMYLQEYICMYEDDDKKVINPLYKCLVSHKNEDVSVLELGCGLGVPGMIASLMGAKVILSDQESLLQQMEKNIETNFRDDERESKIIQAMTLDWSRSNVNELLRDSGMINGFDVVLNCDCVFEPLYGESWRLLVEVIDELLQVNKNCLILSSVERRNGDGIEKFLDSMMGSESVSSVQLVQKDKQNNIEIYLTLGNSSIISPG